MSFGITMLVMGQLAKASLPIKVMLFGRFISLRDIHPQKALEFIVSTPSGMYI
jgi:hypothetical protein